MCLHEFLLADKRCVIDAEVFRKILDICPRKEGEDFTEVQNDEDTLTFLVDLGYSGPLHKYTNMFVDTCIQPWWTSGLALHQQVSIWKDNLARTNIAYQIDHRREKKSRRENMPYPRFTKVIIDYFLSKHKSLKKLKFQHFHTIKDDGVNIQRVHPVFMVKLPPSRAEGKVLKGRSLQIPLKNLLICLMSLNQNLLSEGKPLVEELRRKPPYQLMTQLVPELQISFGLGKSISLTEAEEEAAARQVHATHARIVSESILEPARRRQSNIVISETTQKLKGIQTLSPTEQEAVDIMKALKDSRRMFGRQPGTGGSDEGTGEIPGVSDESIYADVEDDNEETKSDSDDIYKYRINVRKNADTEMKAAEKTADITKETTKQPLTSSSFSLLDKYLWNKLDDASHSRLLEKTHCRFSWRNSLSCLLSESSKKQESEKSQEEIIRIKREQEEKNQEPSYTIKSSNQAALEEFDLKSKSQRGEVKESLSLSLADPSQKSPQKNTQGLKYPNVGQKLTMIREERPASPESGMGLLLMIYEADNNKMGKCFAKAQIKIQRKTSFISLMILALHQLVL
ncbi:hypothetical protein Tco_0245264 [Tanacetum coccineum]